MHNVCIALEEDLRHLGCDGKLRRDEIGTAEDYQIIVMTIQGARWPGFVLVQRYHLE